MGGKAGTARTAAASSAEIDVFVAAIAPQHRATFDALRALIKRVAPTASENLKWGTLQFDRGGSLFALSAPRKEVNLYILTLGVIAAHREELAGIPQSKCVLRFAPGRKPPMRVLERVLRAAAAGG